MIRELYLLHRNIDATLQRAGGKTCHLLCGELTIAEEFLHKCMADFLEALSPCLEGTSRTKAFLGPQLRQSSYTKAQSHVLSLSAAASSKEKKSFSIFNPGLEENDAAQSLHEHCRCQVLSGA